MGGLGSGGDGFAADPLEQTGAELTDLAAGSRRVGGLELRGQAAGVDVVQCLTVGQEPLVGGLPGVVDLGELGPTRVLVSSFCCGVNRLIGNRAAQIWFSTATSPGLS